MAKLWTTGPVHIYVGLGGGNFAKTPLYLGTGEQAPDIDIDYEYEGVPNDIGGHRIPFDRNYQGSEGDISVVLTRWNEIPLTILMSQPFLGDSSFVPGVGEPGDIGTLMGSEGYTFPVWLVFPYAPTAPGISGPAQHPAMAGMVPGYRFWSCLNMGDRIRPGSKAKRHHIMWHAQRAWTQKTTPEGYATIGSFDDATTQTKFVLYDNIIQGLPPID